MPTLWRRIFALEASRRVASFGELETDFAVFQFQVCRKRAASFGDKSRKEIDPIVMSYHLPFGISARSF